MQSGKYTDNLYSERTGLKISQQIKNGNDLRTKSKHKKKELEVITAEIYQLISEIPEDELNGFEQTLSGLKQMLKIP